MQEGAMGSGRPSGGSPDSASAAAHLLGLFGRRSSSLPRSGSPMKRSASGTQPMCLICLENLTAEDFEVGPPPLCTKTLLIKRHPALALATTPMAKAKPQPKTTLCQAVATS